MALLKEYRYHDSDANRREFYFLRDAGHIKPRYGGFIDFDANLEGANIVDRAEPTPIGYLAVRLRKGDIAQNMIDDGVDSSDARRWFIMEPVLQQRLAKWIVLLECFRNSALKDLHAGISPCSVPGDYSDVLVNRPYGAIPDRRSTTKR
jgi:hypothetical protein